MADITMCIGLDQERKVECPMRHHCRRYLARPDPLMQSWFAELPLKDDGTCSEFCEP